MQTQNELHRRALAHYARGEFSAAFELIMELQEVGTLPSELQELLDDIQLQLKLAEVPVQAGSAPSPRPSGCHRAPGTRRHPAHGRRGALLAAPGDATLYYRCSTHSHFHTSAYSDASANSHPGGYSHTAAQCNTTSAECNTGAQP